VPNPRIELPEKLVPVFLGEADVRGAYGGRGSAKTRSFAKMTAVRAAMWDAQGREGQILCARQFMNSLADRSFEEIKAAILSEAWLAAVFEIGDRYIKTRSGRIYYTFAGLDRNISSIKSKARILLCWVDEAEPVTETAWVILIPTLREEDSELWVTWNPERKAAPVHKRFREIKDPRYKVIELNWRDNPWFPEVLERQRKRDLEYRPDQYKHIWEGDFVSFQEGAYLAAQLRAAELEGRIGKLGRDPLMRLRAYWDLGGRGMKSDATAIWVAQFIGKSIHVLDHYEAVGQPIGAHVDWLRTRKYEKALCVLPHDGEPKSPVADASWQTALEAAGFEVEIVPNQGAGAARQRIEAARRIFPIIWFNAETTVSGREALGWYHEKLDDERKVGLGPEHDWSSHSADAFGMMCQVYEPPTKTDLKEYDVDTSWVV
jgi:phage terminase large subunit